MARISAAKAAAKANGAQIDLGKLNPKQVEFINSKARYCGYGGARGGGKSHAVRIDAVRGALKYAGIKVLIVRRRYTDLQGNYVEPLNKLIPSTIAEYNSQLHQYYFINGSTIKLGHFQSYQQAADEYQGQEFDWIFMDEATQFTEAEFRLLGGCIDNTARPVYTGNSNINGGAQNVSGRSLEADSDGISGVYAERNADYQGQRGFDSVPIDSGLVLSAQAQNAIRSRGVDIVETKDVSANSAAFSAALDESRAANAQNGWAVTPKSTQEIAENGVRVYMNDSESAGYGIAPDGDIEAVFANKSKGAPRRALASMMPQAIANGGTKLDCYGEGLVTLYAQYGFVPVARVQFNAEYANEGWTPDKGTPDIYFMMATDLDPDSVVQNFGNYPVPTQAQLDALPVMDYDEAYAYRDELLAQQQSNLPKGTGAAELGFTENRELNTSRYRSNTIERSYDPESVADYGMEADNPSFQYEVKPEGQTLSRAQRLFNQLTEGDGISAVEEWLLEKQEWTAEDADLAEIATREITRQLEEGLDDPDMSISEYNELAEIRANIAHEKSAHMSNAGQVIQTLAKWTRESEDSGAAAGDTAISAIIENENLSEQERYDAVRQVVRWQALLEGSNPNTEQGRSDLTRTIMEIGEQRGVLNWATIRSKRAEITRSMVEKSLNALSGEDLQALAHNSLAQVGNDQVYSADVGKKMKCVQMQREIGDEDYIQYLDAISAHDTHAGYFSVDKKGKMTDSKLSDKKEGTSDDIDAYDLIMKNKELLLDRDPKKSPVRFIFSHSALREGWDNPNVFQICTLKQSSSEVRKRQEVGRGLRLCVNQDGERMDANVLGNDVQSINVLTVIASESYDSFAKGLQTELADAVAGRPVAVTADLFKGKVIVDARGNEQVVDGDIAQAIFEDLISNGYVKRGVLTDKYYADKANGAIQVAEEVADSRDSVINILDSVYDNRAMQPENARDKNVELQVDPDKLAMPEFKALWKRISPKSVYVVDFDTDELVNKAIASINRNLHVPKIFFKVETGAMDEIKSKDSLLDGSAFSKSKSSTYDSSKQIRVGSSVKYDLIGKLVGETGLTRKAVVAILTGIEKSVFEQFKFNPEEFIIKAAALINDEKATAIIQHITYNVLDEHYDTDIFTEPTIKGKLGTNAMKAQRHLYDHIMYDSTNERDFAADLDANTDVAVYVKLPDSFYIATPVGHYNPDWAIAFYEGTVKHIYFVAETKGSMSSMQLRLIEESKIHCAREHFKAISNGNVVYDVVDSYQTLLERVMK